MGRAFLEPSTLSIFTPHLYPGIFSEYKLCLHFFSSTVPNDRQAVPQWTRVWKWKIWWRCQKVCARMVCSSFDRYFTYHRYNLIIQHETLRVGVLGKKNLKSFLRTFSSWSSQRTLSAGRGKVARLFSCRQPRQFRALSTTLKRCAKSTCTGSWVWSWCKEAIYSELGFQGWRRYERSLWWEER